MPHFLVIDIGNFSLVSGNSVDSGQVGNTTKNSATDTLLDNLALSSLVKFLIVDILPQVIWRFLLVSQDILVFACRFSRYFLSRSLQELSGVLGRLSTEVMGSADNEFTSHKGFDIPLSNMFPSNTISHLIN